MKKLNFLLFVFLFALVSCTQANDDAVAPSTISDPNPINYSALIVGKWQLSEIGKIQTVSSSGGCNSSGSETTHEVVNWSQAQVNETLEFKESGDFAKGLDKDAQCKGTYKIFDSTLLTKSDCAQADAALPIDVMYKTEMTLLGREDNEVVKYKYVKF